MLSSKDSISPADWLNEDSISESARRTRSLVLKFLAEANERNTPEEVYQDILADKYTPYTAAKRLLTFLRTKKAELPVPRTETPQFRDRGLALSTIAVYRSLLPGFFESVLGEENFSRRVFDRLVKIEKNANNPVTSKKAPKVDELKRLLRLAGPRDRALLGMLACTGCRISEAISRKMSDLIRRKEGYAVIELTNSETKAGENRKMFVTKEVVDFIDDYHRTVKSDWIFPGDDKTRHVVHDAARQSIERLFGSAGLKSTRFEVYTPHSMRTFADSQMAKCGLDRKYIALIIGHKSKLSSEARYKDWDEVEAEWFKLCHDKMTWLVETKEVTREITVIKPNTKLQAQVNDLQAQLVKLSTPEGLLNTLAKILEQEGSAPWEIVAKKLGILKEAQKQLEDKSKTPKPTVEPAKGN